jgi:hypothetical protein
VIDETTDAVMRMHASLRRPTEPVASPAFALLLTACGAGSSDRIGTSSESPREEPHRTQKMSAIEPGEHKSFFQQKPYPTGSYIEAISAAG